MLNRFFKFLARCLLFVAGAILAFLIMAALIQYYPQVLMIGFFLVLIMVIIYYMLKNTFG
jgi:hypothetical protein